jgi:hypothetical protein
MKTLIIVLSGVGRGLSGGDGLGELTNVQCKVILNCQQLILPYNEYMLMKIKKKKKCANIS